ncbi:HNH endonuclease signature motif containing protein [Jatrophihabitans fulvus]
MTTALGSDSATDALARYRDAVAGLRKVPLDELADAELTDLVRDVETVSRQFAPVPHRLTAELDRRGLAHEHGCASSAAFLVQLLRISTGEARARVRAAERLAPRRTLTGEPLAPQHPVVARAQADGEISDQHAAEIARTIEKLPSAIDERGEVEGIETFLVEQARLFAPEQLAKITRHLLDVLDPDGSPDDDERRERQRDLTFRQRADGSVTGRFEGTAALGELLQTALDVTAAPKPSADGSRDLRTPGQRRHDGLMDALRMTLRSQQLPTANGVVSTVVITATAEQWASGEGLVRTGHGALVTVPTAKAMGLGESRLFPVVLGADAGANIDGFATACASIARIFRSVRPIEAYGTAHRLFTERDRLAMIARDIGCTFPGCTVPALWCEADHVTDWADTGRTGVDDGHLACPHHHREKRRNGWDVIMIDRIPHWVPPSWVDRDRVPRRNRAHDPTSV